MLTKLYHGSSSFSAVGGYQGGKVNNFQYGVGLYCTNSFEWASHYGRRTYVLDVDLDLAKASHNIEIKIADLRYWVVAYCTKKLLKVFDREFSQRESLSAERFEIFLHWNIKHFTPIAVALAAFMTAQGVTHTIECGLWSGELVRIFDFSIIKGASYDKADLKALNYDDIELPEEVQRYKKYTITVD